MTYIPTLIAPYGLQLFSYGIRSSTFGVRATTNGFYYTAFLAIDDVNGTSRLIDQINQTALDMNVCQLLSGQIELGLLLI